ncbi:MAG TPA: FG-GAP-like repeat-containing protein [Planctomycetia bacterium]|nr:FG-GAP-like repeat-containing protein [Planctomycetia bacterium]
MVCNLLFGAIAALFSGLAPDFGPPASIPGSGSPHAVADFNGDGKPDIAMVRGAYFRTLLGLGDGSFQPALDSPLGGDGGQAVGFLAVGDFNGDGAPDLVTERNFGSQFNHCVIALGNGDGTFAPVYGVAGSAFANSNYVSVGDFNGDRISDLVVTHYLDTGGGWLQCAVSVLVNDGRGGFNVSQYLDFNFGANGFPGRTLVADFDRDGALDLALQQQDYADASLYGVSFMAGNGDGTFGGWDFHAFQFPTTVLVAIGYFPESHFFAGDFDGDGALDVAVGATLFMGNGDATFEPGVFLWEGDGAADFDRDGKLDVFGQTAPESVLIMLGLGDGSLRPPRATYVPDIHGYFAITAADFNRDGLPDLVVTTYSGLKVLINDGNWTGAPLPPAISIANNTFTEGDSGSSAGTVAVTLSAPSLLPVTVDFVTVADTATAGADYQHASGTVTFAPGETSKTIPVVIIGDTLAEPIYEYFKVVLSNPTNGVIATAEGVCAIYSEEQPNPISISDYSATEGKNGNKKFVFTVALAARTDQPVTVSYATADGTATTVDNDYFGATGTLTFAPGETSKTITVNVRGDKKREPDESFFVNLSGASANAVLADSQGVGTIVNDD